ncbi:esterase FE4-like [Photinus pyralis]|uniref:Carboxylesterase type B domain-containing protein n=1 Tax=Photinus pyralis TaxID=7054 RepID=A0A1Y1L0A2_PHOPY|nr:esterase FE4-like [Photinus pyralis]
MLKLTLFVIVFIPCCKSTFPSIEIKQGILNGKFMRARNGKEFSAFLGIPYAKPPVKDLRFKPPISADPWEGVRDATTLPPSCPQKDRYQKGVKVVGDEDCLFVNIYTPQLHKDESDLYPVMVFIHGGGFYFGTGTMYGPDYLLEKDIILVTFNYRIGALGFLSTGDDVVPGNNGFKDQSLAIKWVSENIAAFGGDPKKITLFGEAAGGASAHFHYFSPLSHGLFSSAISQSGTAFNIWSLADRSLVATKASKLATALGCSSADNKVMVECMRLIEPSEIIEKDKIFMEWDIEPFIPFKPVVEVEHEGAFLARHPLEIVQNGGYAQLPWVTGVNGNEGVIKVAALNKNPDRIVELDQEFNRIMGIIFEKGASFENAAKRIRKFYFGEQSINNSTLFNLVDMFSDYLFFVGVETAVDLHLKHSNQPVYYYFFNHQSPNSFSRVVGVSNEPYGASHADELPLLFPLEFLFENRKQTELDRRMSKLMTELWTNFARLGNPTPAPTPEISTLWEPVKSEDLEYLYIGGGLHTAKKLLPERIRFWKDELMTANHLKDEL